MSSPSLTELKIGFIGAGAMARAMMTGLVKSGKVTAKSLYAADPYEECRKLAEEIGAKVSETNAKVASNADIIVISVKPSVVGPALASIANALEERQKSGGRPPLVVSIAAGVRLATFEAALPTCKIVRTMPNTPCLVGEAAVGIAGGKFATESDLALAALLFTGVTVVVAEKDLDAVTALSGSGPAYVFLFIESLADAGVRAGLTRDVALRLAAQTVKGAATMQIETGKHPAVLKDTVCSPGGTTIAGVEALEQNGFRFAAMSAVAAANKRSLELANN